MTIHQTLEKYFGYKSFRPGQEEIINTILDGKNVLAILPTGAGKSICYQVPALASDGFAIVISPLIALMKDQVDALNKIERTSAFINSSLDYREGEKVLNDVANNKINLLYVSPEKLENQYFADRLKNLKPKFLFIDEAHCISEWGHNFRPSYRRIKDLIEFMDFQNVAAFTATATPEVRDDIIAQLNLSKPKIFVKGFERNNLHLYVRKTKNKNEALQKIFSGKGFPAIIYTATRKQAETASAYLQKRGFNSQHYHAGLSNEVRRMIQDDFINDRIDVISATNAFGMGIDKKDIRTIVHYNIPASIENYYQEIGRAGRDGEDSNIYLLFNERDKGIHQFLINSSYPTREQIETAYQLICDHGKIALGSKSEKAIEIDEALTARLKLNEINSSLLNSSLKILEEAGYLELNNTFGKGYSFQFQVTPQQLRKFTKSISNETAIDLLLHLLREFGSSAFDKMIKIDLDNVAEKIGITKNECIEELKRADGMGIISFELPLNNNSVKISTARVKKENLQLNLQNLHKLKQMALHRLEEMESLVYAKECRFRVILKYFGEEVSGYKCGKCDICTNTEDNFTIAEFIESKIIETLRETPEPLSLNELKEILLDREKNDKFLHISTFGTASHFNENEIDKSVNSLLHLKQIEKLTGGKYDLSGIDLELEYDKPIENTYEPYLQLYNTLRQIRKDAAGKFGQSPNLICPDKVIKEVAEKKPDNPTALLSVNGFTQRMYNKVGEEFLNAIKESITNSDESDKLEKNKVPDTTKQILDLVKKRYSLADISSLTKLPEAVVSMQIETLLSLFPNLIIDSLIDHRKASKILDVIQSGITNIKELKSSLSKDISYGEIRIVLAKEKSSSKQV